MLWTLEIRPPVVDGLEGEMNLGDDAYPEGGFALPNPFPARFLSRSKEKIEMVKEQWEIAAQ